MIRPVLGPAMSYMQVLWLALTVFVFGQALEVVSVSRWNLVPEHTTALPRLQQHPKFPREWR